MTKASLQAFAFLNVKVFNTFQITLALTAQTPAWKLAVSGTTRLVPCAKMKNARLARALQVIVKSVLTTLGLSMAPANVCQIFTGMIISVEVVIKIAKSVTGNLY
jgi:hypothetical protein